MLFSVGKHRALMLRFNYKYSSLNKVIVNAWVRLFTFELHVSLMIICMHIVCLQNMLYAPVNSRGFVIIFIIKDENVCLKSLALQEFTWRFSKL